ncbi:MAG: sn-glycerol-3-phosphate ABC transporter ATP-binding protein UgpC [Deltaproteobacteria bacterium]|nr:sn-glycerol-3-phosphate ABC transporter ATP-binding protein UgpC [Deltaproteobacteria bacterium]
MVALSIRELSKRFGDTVVLKDVDLSVPDGAFAVLVGPSGCGKSTLLRLLAGLERPTTGSIRFGDRDVTKLEPRERDVAMVFQSYALYPHLNVRDNLAFGLKLRKEAPAEITKRVTEVSEMLGLSALLDRMPRALSGGQRQRVAMGRAVVRRPSLFLFDEPLSNLDAALRAQVRVDIRKLHAKLETTSVYVTHDQVEAMTLADVMFILNDGVVEQSGKPLEIYDAPATRFVASFLGSPAMNFLDGEVSRDGQRVAVVVGKGSERVQLPIEPGRFTELEEGRAVCLGVRPHDLVTGSADDDGTAPVTVTFTEALGGETYAHGELAGFPVVARLDATTPVVPGDQVHLAPKRLQLFDADSGKSLRC